MPPSQHLDHGLLRRGVRDAGQTQDEIIYASTMVDQDRYPAQGHPSRVAHKEHVFSEIPLHILRKRGLRLCLTHNIVIAGGNDHFYALSYTVEPLCRSFVLGIYVHDGQIILLTGIDANPVHQISGNHYVLHLRSQAGSIVHLAVEPLQKSLPGISHEVFASHMQIREQQSIAASFFQRSRLIGHIRPEQGLDKKPSIAVRDARDAYDLIRYDKTGLLIDLGILLNDGNYHAGRILQLDYAITFGSGLNIHDHADERHLSTGCALAQGFDGPGVEPSRENFPDF